LNLPSLSWSIAGLPFPNILSPGSLVSKLYCDSLGSLQNVKYSTFHKHDGDTNTILDQLFTEYSQRIHDISHQEPLQDISMGYYVINSLFRVKH